jgi:hypothetical protein
MDLRSGFDKLVPVRTIDPCFGGDCSAKRYLRVDDNQLGIFGDVYLSKK